MLVPFLLLSVVAFQQPGQGALAPTPVARITFPSAEVQVVAGDSAQVRPQALDASGRPVANARFRFNVVGYGSFESRVNDSTGMVRAGYPGSFDLAVTALVPGASPSAPTIVRIRLVPGPATRVEVTPNVSRIVSGQQVVLHASAYSARGELRDDRVEWRSSAPSIARVSDRGIVTGVGTGTATITAAVPGATGRLAVTVGANTIRLLDITGGAAEARTGDVLDFGVRARDAAGREVAGIEPQWSMSPGNGDIGERGEFVAYLPGEYTVTAIVANSSVRTTVRVRPRDVTRSATVVGRVPVKAGLTGEFWPHPNKRNAYLSTIGDRVYALDISDPAKIRITDSVLVDAHNINDVMTTADGRYAVMTREGASSRRNGIVILDLADPTHPKKLSEYTETVTGGVHSAYVFTQPTHGTHVYLTDDATGSMRVIDINDPAQPKEIARWQTPDAAGRTLHDIDVKDGIAYLSYWNEGLVILDIGNGVRGGTPAKPQFISQFKYQLAELYREVEAVGGAGFVRGTHTAWRAGKYVFVGDEVFSTKPQGVVLPVYGLGKANGRLHVIDVSDITKPKEVAWYEPKDGGVHNVWVAGDTVYVGDYQGGLRVVDVSGELRGDLLAQGREIAHVHTGDAAGFVPNAAMAWGAFYVNGLVWVNDMMSGLWVIRIEPKTRIIIP